MDAEIGASADYVAWLDSMWARRLLSARDGKPDLSVGILLWPGFPLMSLTGVLEPLRHAADFADNSQPLHCRWSIMGGPGHATVASCGIRVQSDAPYINPTDFDYVAVIGGLLPQLRTAPPQHRSYLRAAAAAGVKLIGICTGVFVLAQEDLLAGHRAAVHPFHAEDFRIAFPRLALSTRHDFLQSGQITTVPGGVSVLSLLTELIRTHCGPDRAAKSVHQLSLTARTGVSAFDRGRAVPFRDVGDARIQRAVVLIESRKGGGVSPDDAARAAGLSPRQFARRFNEVVGATPKRFILDTRLRYARFLVENSTMSITAIAFETGFADCAHLSTAFRARFDAPPRSFRIGFGTSHSVSENRKV